MLKVNNEDTRTTTNDVVLVSLLLTLSIFLSSFKGISEHVNVIRNKYFKVLEQGLKPVQS